MIKVKLNFNQWLRHQHLSFRMEIETPFKLDLFLEAQETETTYETESHTSRFFCCSKR